MLFDKKIFSNSIWMMLEKFLNIFGLIFVNSYMAKYIGPENFGKLAFTTSCFVFVQTLSWFGAQNILFKHFSKNIKSGINLSISTQNIRLYIYLITSLCALTYLWFSSDTLTFIFGLGNFIASYFIISDIFTIHNNSQLISIVNTITNAIGLILALILRFILVKLEADYYTMIFPIIIVSLVPFLLKRNHFYKKNIVINNIKNKSKYNKYIFITGGGLVLSTLSIALYTQISNIFLAEFTSFSALAIYNISMTIGGAWGFINIALITSYFSKIYETKDNYKEQIYLRQIHLIVIGTTLFILIFVYFFGSWIIHKLYGESFIQSSDLLPLIVIGTMISALGTISYRYMIKFNAYKYLSIKMFIVSLLAIPLSYILIKKYGVVGAAWCFIITEFISLTIANYFFKDKIILKLHLKALGFNKI